MKKFSRCALLLIAVTIIAAAAGYIYEDRTITPMYTSTATLIVTPGEENEASVRATNGGLINDFEIVIKSSTVISAAQRAAGTSENIADYLTVKALPNSNVLELTCTNPDQATAKAYVDAVAKNVSKVTDIIPVKSIQVLEYGDESNISVKPDLYKKTAFIAGCAAAAGLFLELVVVFVIGAFKKPEDNSDDEFEYERRYGRYSGVQQMSPVVPIKRVEADEDEDEAFEKAMSSVAASIENEDVESDKPDNDEFDNKPDDKFDGEHEEAFHNQGELDNENELDDENGVDVEDGFELEDDFETDDEFGEDEGGVKTGNADEAAKDNKKDGLKGKVKENTKKPRSSSEVIGIIKK